MTLIAAIRPEQFPVLIGDILLSRMLKPEGQIVLPGAGPITENFRPDGEYYLAGQRQKVVLLNNDLVAAWAGSLSVARKVLLSMQKHFDNTSPSLMELGKFCKENIPSGADLSLVIASHEAGKCLNVCSWGAARFDTEYFGECRVAGSGTGFFSECIYPDEMVLQSLGKEASIWQRVFSTSLLISNMLLGQEILVGDNLNHYFGGGYEITLFNGTEFRKVGDTIRLFWHCHKSKDGVRATLIPTVLKFDYLRDHLIVRKIQIAQGKPEVEREDVFVVSSSLSDDDVAPQDLLREALKIDWNAQYMCATMVVTEDDKPPHVFGTINGSASRQQPFRVELTPSAITLGFESGFWQRALESVAKGPVDITGV